MSGIVGTGCKIKGCDREVWPSIEIGLCAEHYREYVKKRIASLLKKKKVVHIPTPRPYTLKKKCEACHRIFIATTGRARWCPNCSEKERIKKEKAWHQKRKDERRRRKYLNRCLDLFVGVREGQARPDLPIKPVCSDRNISIRNLRRDGKKYRELAEMFNITYQRVQQICAGPKDLNGRPPLRTKNIS